MHIILLLTWHSVHTGEPWVVEGQDHTHTPPTCASSLTNRQGTGKGIIQSVSWLLVVVLEVALAHHAPFSCDLSSEGQVRSWDGRIGRQGALWAVSRAGMDREGWGRTQNSLFLPRATGLWRDCKILWVSTAIVQTGKLKPTGIEGWPVLCVVMATLSQLAQPPLGRAGQKREQRVGKSLGQLMWDLEWFEDVTNFSPSKQRRSCFSLALRGGSSAGE